MDWRACLKVDKNKNDTTDHYDRPSFSRLIISRGQKFQFLSVPQMLLIIACRYPPNCLHQLILRFFSGFFKCCSVFDSSICVWSQPSHETDEADYMYFLGFSNLLCFIRLFLSSDFYADVLQQKNSWVLVSLVFRVGLLPHAVQTSPTPWVKKWWHPNHGYNFVSSWSICKILSMLQRAVNFQQNPH